MIQCAEESLRRLGTDYVDILYLHKEDHDTPLAETVRALAALHPRRQDPVLRRVEPPRLAHRRDLPSLRPDGHRPADREPALLSRALSRGGGRAASGLRELRHRRRELFAARARRAHRQISRRAPRPRRIRAPAAPTSACWKPRCVPRRWRPRRSSSSTPTSAASRPSHLAVAWVLNNKLMTGVVAGPRTEAQWDDYVKALDVTFTAEDEAFVERSRRHGSSGGAGLQRSAVSDRGPGRADRIIISAHARESGHPVLGQELGSPLSRGSSDSGS